MTGIKNAVKRILIRYRSLYLRTTGLPVRVNIGSGTHHYPGWIGTDQPVLDITRAKDWTRYFPAASIDSILAEHVFEHLTLDEARAALVNIRAHLKPGGTFRIAVPDGNHPSQYVIDLVKPGGLDVGSDDHQVLYTIDLLTSMGKEAGFKVEPIEYFDTEGIFHEKPFDIENGAISRSAHSYRGRFTQDEKEMRRFLESIPEKLRPQFIEKRISFTSLLADFIA